MWAAPPQDASGRWFTGLGAVTNLNGTGVAAPWYDNPARTGLAPRPRQRISARGRAHLRRRNQGRPHRPCPDLRLRPLPHRALHPTRQHPGAESAQVDAVGSRGIPMGGRIQLDPAWDVEGSALTPAGKVIARALQEYGAYCGDYAGANVLYGENSPAAVAAWSRRARPRTISHLCSRRISFARTSAVVIDLGNLLPGQNLERPPPYLLAFVLPDGTAARIDQWDRTIELPAGAKPVAAKWRAWPEGTTAAGQPNPTRWTASPPATPAPACGGSSARERPDDRTRQFFAADVAAGPSLRPSRASSRCTARAPRETAAGKQTPTRMADSPSRGRSVSGGDERPTPPSWW